MMIIPDNIVQFLGLRSNVVTPRQTAVAVGVALLLMITFTTMQFQSSVTETMRKEDAASRERRLDVERHQKLQAKKLAAQEEHIELLQNQINDLQRQFHKHDPSAFTTTPRPTTTTTSNSKRKKKPSTTSTSCDCSSDNNNNNPYLHSESASSNHGSYEPKFFYPGQIFEEGQTPLTILQKNPQARPSEPGWSGGYGWVFEKYHPSDFELRWKFASYGVEKIMDGTPLMNLRDGIFKAEKEAYMADLHRFPSNTGKGRSCTRGDQLPEEPLEFNPKIYSKFEYVWKCTFPPCHEIIKKKNITNSSRSSIPNQNNINKKNKPSASSSGSGNHDINNEEEDEQEQEGPQVGDRKFSYIEPLVGILRHPNATPVMWPSILDKNYMLIDPWPLVHGSRSTVTPRRQRVLYFDAGASVWDQGSGGASQSWFYDVYRAECLNFSGWFMWESDPRLNQSTVFAQLPKTGIIPNYRWYNIELSTDPKNWNNPINHLLLEAHREDIVILKIDFDAPFLELGLIHSILELPQVWELVDELFFEHHINTEVLRWSWHTQNAGIWHSDSLKLFTQLREKGIRAHSWV